MAEFNTYHKHEETSQAALGEQEEYRRLREEIQQQVEAERATAATLEQQQEQARQKSMMAAWQRENARQRETNQNAQVTQSPVRRRAFGMDALLLCAVTMGVGLVIGPSIQGIAAHRAPYAAAVAAAPSAWMAAPFTIGGTDVAGNVWDGSNMEITSVQPMSDGTEQLTGHFGWQEGGSYAGREDFTGSYDPSTRSLHLEGYQVEQAGGGSGNRLVPGQYDGQLGADGKTLENFHMQQLPNGPSAIPGALSGVQVR